ncbi:centrosomal protein 43-like [Bolinopsis microptera]|uniref:centrosomal protein 43-like n=1 Tax=Bolinopsis microptera TaxID=2820187 RepID=UPI0030797D11
MSAGDEDTELRDLVTQTLENNGLLGKIQAQLRAGVFLALEDTDKKNRKVHHNKRLQQFLSTKEGLLAAGIVQEFLEFFQLDYTGAVFEPETGMSGKYEGRPTLERQIDYDVSDELPLIAAIIKQSCTGGHNVHLNRKDTVSSNTRGSNPSSTAEDPINDSMDFLSNRKPIEDMVNRYANSNTQILSPPHQYKEGGRIPDHVTPDHVTSSDRMTSPDRVTSPLSEQISEQISEHISEHISTEHSSQMDQSNEKEDLHSTREWDEECKNLDDKLEKIGIKTSTDVGDKTYDDDFERNTSATEEVSGISDIDDLLHTSEIGTEKGAEESMFTSDHTISVDSVGDIDYVEDITF